MIAAVEDETGAETEIIQASENNGDAIIKVTSYDETATKTYTVRFIISDSESRSAFISSLEKVFSEMLFGFSRSNEESLLTRYGRPSPHISSELSVLPDEME